MSSQRKVVVNEKDFPALCKTKKNIEVKTGWKAALLTEKHAVAAPVVVKVEVVKQPKKTSTTQQTYFEYMSEVEFRKNPYNNDDYRYAGNPDYDYDWY
jgi:hypothetical protein